MQDKFRNSKGYLKMRRLVLILFIALWILPAWAKEDTPKKQPERKIDDWTLYKRAGHKSEAWNELVEGGFFALSNNNLVTGNQLLERALSLGCKDPLVYLKVGQYYENKEDYQKAADFYKKATPGILRQYAKTPYAEIMHETYGRVLFALNQYADAKQQFTAQLESKPKSFTSLFLLGQISKTEGDLPAAIDYFTRASEAPLPTETTTNIPLTIAVELAQAYYQTGDIETSMNYCKQALGLDPKNPLVLKIKANIERAIQKKHEQEMIQKLVQ